MKDGISEEIKLFIQELQHFLSPAVLQKMSKETGFIRRNNKYH